MELNIKKHDEDGYVEIVTSGLADQNSSLNMAHAIAYTMRTHRITKVLIDHRNIEDVVGKNFDIYHRTKRFRLMGVIL